MSLTPKILELHATGKYTQAEIAKILKCTRQNVYAALNKSKRKRDCKKEYQVLKNNAQRYQAFLESKREYDREYQRRKRLKSKIINSLDK